jgi:hypothetical protein
MKRTKWVFRLETQWARPLGATKREQKQRARAPEGAGPPQSNREARLGHIRAHVLMCCALSATTAFANSTIVRTRSSDMR